MTMANFYSASAFWILIFTLHFHNCTVLAQAFGKPSTCEVSDDNACREDKPDGSICSNRGACVCGECNCFQRVDPAEVISGQYCQCDNFSCAQNNANAEVCSGRKHGKCVCGICQCEPGWYGKACQYPTRTWDYGHAITLI